MKKFLSILLSVLILASSIITGYSEQNENIKIGDVDFDGEISVLDATYIQLYLADKKTFTQEQKKAADTDSSGSISIIDATLIQKLLADLIPEFPQNPDKDEELLAIANKMNSVQNENTLSLSVLSDVHFDEKLDSAKAKLENIEKLGQLQSLTNIDYTVNLGDFVNGNEAKQATITSLTTFLEKSEELIDAPVLNVRGNHDDNGWYTYGKFGGSNMPDEIINDEEWHNLALTKLPDNFVFDENNPYGGYGYIDHESSKIRIFMLNSCDIPYVLNDDGSYRYNSYTGHAFSDYQLDFVADALHFSDKENPNDWAALFLTHVPLDTSNADDLRFGTKSALIRGHEYLLAIISAYKNGTSFKASGSAYNPSNKNDRSEDFLVSVDVDYSNKGCGEVIAFMSGHTHTNNYTNEAGYKNSLSYGYTFIGTIGSSNFSNYVINRENNTISAFSYGKVVPETAQGNVTTPPNTGSIESGEWVVSYSQFVPNKESIYNGVSEKHPMYYTLSDDSKIVDLETLELDNSVKVAAARQLTKAIAVKPFTTYIIPDDYKGDCLSFSSSGARRAFLKPVDHGDYKTITTDIRQYYIVFSLDTNIYKDYKNFYIKEMVYGIE
ncbi:MAG: metallophosphoesterase [Ruminococcus sp.]|nr:metallophosphoesterase [Ruminococcus sp.]